MSNEKRGRIPIELDDGTHELRFPNAAMRELQERFHCKSPGDIWKQMGEWGADDWLAVMFAGLKNGSDPHITKNEVDDLIIGTEVPYYQVVLMGALTAALEGRQVSGRVQRMIDKRLVEALGDEGDEPDPQ